MKTTYLLASLLLIGAGCMQQPIPSPNPAPAPSPQPETSASFDAMTAMAGDRFGAWTVAKIGPAMEGVPMSVGNQHVEFSGSATVTGRYEHYVDDFYGKSLVCLRLDDAEAQKLPDGSTHFCLTDFESLESSFGPLDSQGTATIVISDYRFNLIAESDGSYWEAKLVSVVDVSGTESMVE